MFPSEVVVIPVTFGIPAAVVLAFRWFRHREHMATLGAPPAPEHARAVEARLARLEQAVESVAIEVERVTEGQRFIARLLTERPPLLADPSAAGRERVNTPLNTPH